MNEPRHVIATYAGPCEDCDATGYVGLVVKVHCPFCHGRGWCWAVTDAPAPPPGEPWILLTDVLDKLGAVAVTHRVLADTYAVSEPMRWHHNAIAGGCDELRDVLAALAKGGQ